MKFNLILINPIHGAMNNFYKLFPILGKDYKQLGDNFFELIMGFKLEV